VITFTEFAAKKNLIKDSNILKHVELLESSLSKENFKDVSKNMYQYVFDEDPDEDIFTGHKFFHTKVVKPSFTRVDLMEKGLHAFRMVMARHAERLRYPGMTEFDTEGVVMYENFLSEEDHEK